MYTVYYGPRGSGNRIGAFPGQLSSRSFSSMPEALLWARSAAGKGRAIVRLEGDDGTDLNRNDLACAFRLLGGPRGAFAGHAERE